MDKEQKEEIVNILVAYVRRVANENNDKKPEEIAALPAIVETLFKYY